MRRDDGEGPPSAHFLPEMFFLRREEMGLPEKVPAGATPAFLMGVAPFVGVDGRG